MKHWKKCDTPFGETKHSFKKLKKLRRKKNIEKKNNKKHGQKMEREDILELNK